MIWDLINSLEVSETKNCENYEKLTEYTICYSNKKCYHSIYIFFNLNLALCLHLPTISVRLLRVIFGSHLRISTFSVIHKLHTLEPPAYGVHFDSTSHFRLKGASLSFRLQMCCERLVASLYINPLHQPTIKSSSDHH